jgi:hypothetical protein
MVAYNNKQYYIDIVEAKPASAVSIIETDCEVDFAPPLDYKEPEKPIVPASKAPAEGLYFLLSKTYYECYFVFTLLLNLIIDSACPRLYSYAALFTGAAI